MKAKPAKTAVVIGAGPAGLMAAEQLAQSGLAVTIYDRMASPARKFLMAGRGGLNLTHSEDFARFLARYGGSAGRLSLFSKPSARKRRATGAPALGKRPLSAPPAACFRAR